MLIKICGLKSTDDILAVNECLPDYAGFVFAPGKRSISAKEAGFLIKQLDRRVRSVGVFVNPDFEQVKKTIGESGIETIQLHGSEDPQFLRELRNTFGTEIEIWKAIKVKDKNSIKELADYTADMFVLDTFHDTLQGGTGKSFDPSLAIGAAKYGKFLIAGGINIGNAGEAIQKSGAAGIDTSSGVETAGRKDRLIIKELVNLVRSL